MSGTPGDDEPVLVCGHVLKDERPVGLVVHHSDGMWQMACGGYEDHDPDEAGVVHIRHLFDRKDDLAGVCDTLKPGQLAEFESGEWRVSYHDD